VRATDVVTAFARTHAYLAAATNDFFMLNPRSDPSDPDAHNSRAKNDDNFHNGFGSSLFRYAAFVNGYDPSRVKHGAYLPQGSS